jgi:hypothetical protein
LIKLIRKKPSQFIFNSKAKINLAVFFFIMETFRTSKNVNQSLNFLSKNINHFEFAFFNLLKKKRQQLKETKSIKSLRRRSFYAVKNRPSRPLVRRTSLNKRRSIIVLSTSVLAEQEEHSWLTDAMEGLPDNLSKRKNNLDIKAPLSRFWSLSTKVPLYKKKQWRDLKKVKSFTCMPIRISPTSVKLFNDIRFLEVNFNLLTSILVSSPVIKDLPKNHLCFKKNHLNFLTKFLL